LVVQGDSRSWSSFGNIGSPPTHKKSRLSGEFACFKPILLCCAGNSVRNRRNWQNWADATRARSKGQKWRERGDSERDFHTFTFHTRPFKPSLFLFEQEPSFFFCLSIPYLFTFVNQQFATPTKFPGILLPASLIVCLSRSLRKGERGGKDLGQLIPSSAVGRSSNRDNQPPQSEHNSLQFLSSSAKHPNRTSTPLHSLDHRGSAIGLFFFFFLCLFFFFFFCLLTSLATHTKVRLR